MKPVTVYAYKNCDTCRRALKFLSNEGVEARVIPIREQPPTTAELKRMLGYCDGQVRRLFNTSGGDYKAMNLKERLPKLTESEALELLASNGNLVKRPFLLTADAGCVGFREDEWRAVLGLL